MKFDVNEKLGYSTPKNPTKIPMPKNVVSPNDFKIPTGDIERAKKKYLELFNKVVDKLETDEFMGIGELNFVNDMMTTIMKF